MEKSHADGRFEIAGVSRDVIEAFSTRRAEIKAAVAERGSAGPAENRRLAERAALMTRARKRDGDKGALHESWRKQAAGRGFDGRALAADALSRDSGPGAGAARETAGPSREGPAPAKESPGEPGAAAQALDWAVAHLAEREAVFSRADLLAAALAWQPGAVTVEAAERRWTASWTPARFTRPPRSTRATG